MSKTVKIIFATHKKCELPTDPMYFPLQAGAEGKLNDDGQPLDLGIQKDNEGDNISNLNYCFGSQTGLYWGWKHIDADYIGLVHYRRYFLGRKPKKGNEIDCILKKRQLQPMLDKYKVFVPKKRRYYIESLYSHYSHTMNGGKEQLDTTREILTEKYPQYLKAFDKVMRRRWGYMFNLMILRSDLMNSYCPWLFDILFELDNRIDDIGMSDFDKRFCGRVSERLFDVWLQYQLESGVVKSKEVKELPYTENVNWPVKIKSFISAKLFHKKYGESF